MVKLDSMYFFLKKIIFSIVCFFKTKLDAKSAVNKTPMEFSLPLFFCVYVKYYLRKNNSRHRAVVVVIAGLSLTHGRIIKWT